jgi:hypothetical protein
MRKLALPLLVLVLASLASAQTTTANILSNQGCVHIDNCSVFLDNGDHLAMQNSPMYPNHYAYVADNSGVQVAYCNSFSTYENTALPDGTAELHVICGSITVDEHWVGYHTRVGTRYLVLGGTVSY